MNKIYSIFLILFAIIFCIFLISCGKDAEEDYDENFDINKTIGEWYCVQSSDTYNGQTQFDLKVDETVKINGDGTYSSSLSNFGYSGTYTYEGNYITLKSKTGVTSTVLVSIVDDIMLWKGSYSVGKVFSYSFKHCYCNLPAKFVFENTYQVSALHTACNSMGEFCTVTVSKDGKAIVFKGSSVTSNVLLTSIVGYAGFNLGLSGLIVGLPNIPEIGKTESQVVCFELACSNCWEDYNITKPLVVSEGVATCNSCKRTYDLNNTGFITKGEAGRPLYRYRVSYVNNTLVVSNR